MDCPNASPECKYFESKHGCRTNTHHLYYPKRDYTTPVEREFRELFTARWELQLNQARMNDVRDAFKQCYLEWDALQEERQGILSRIVELEQVDVQD